MGPLGHPGYHGLDDKRGFLTLFGNGAGDAPSSRYPITLAWQDARAVGPCLRYLVPSVPDSWGRRGGRGRDGLLNAGGSFVALGHPRHAFAATLQTLPGPVLNGDR